MDEGPKPPTPEQRWRTLIDGYGSYLRRTIARLCPRDLGLQFDEIEQDARIRLWKALQDEREIIDPASYLHRIAATATIDAVRRVKARREEPLEPPSAEDEGERAEPHAALAEASLERSTERRMVMQQVEAALQQLAPERRRLVSLHLQGFTSREIADAHGWTEPKARNLLYRTLRELREKLRDEGIEYEGY